MEVRCTHHGQRADPGCGPSPSLVGVCPFIVSSPFALNCSRPPIPSPVLTFLAPHPHHNPYLPNLTLPCFPREFSVPGKATSQRCG